MTVEILTPERLLYKGEATAITLPGAKGKFQVLEHHAPIISLLTEGKIVLVNGKETKNIAIVGGTIEFNHNKAIILAD